MVVFTTDKKITFPVSSGLLDKNHYTQIGTALWEFLWLIDKVTEEKTEPDGERWGKVLGGKAIRAEEIAESFGSSPDTVKRNMKKLKDNGYIREKRLPRGKAIDVRKSIKWLMRFHGASTTAQTPVCESGSTSNRLSELVSQYRQIPMVVAKERDFGTIGTLCKEHSEQLVAVGIDKLKTAMTRPKAKIDDPLNYLGGIMRQSKNADSADKADSDGEECSICHGKGTYLKEVPFNNGLGMTLRAHVCECRNRLPPWAQKEQ